MEARLPVAVAADVVAVLNLPDSVLHTAEDLLLVAAVARAAADHAPFRPKPTVR